MRYDELSNSIYTRSEVSVRIGKFCANIDLPCFIGLIYGIVRLFKYSVNDWEGWVLFIGAVLSLIGNITYGVTILVEKKESWRLMIFTFLAFFAYLYGCFLVFYKGFWSFKYLFISFSLLKLAVPFIWIVLGYRIVDQLYLLTEFGKAIKEGKIQIEK